MLFAQITMVYITALGTILVIWLAVKKEPWLWVLVPPCCGVTAMWISTFFWR